MKKFSLILCLILTLLASRPKLSRYSIEFWGSFDTMSQIIGYCESEEIFLEYANRAINSFSELGQYYDSFNKYPEIANIKTLNDANGEEIIVPRELFSLLSYSQTISDDTFGAVDPFIGPVTTLWREKINNATALNESVPPNQKSLSEAQNIVTSSYLILDADTLSATIPAGALLDVGSFAKGYAIDMLVQELAQTEIYPFAVLSGGNIKTAGSPPNNRGWKITVQDPSNAIFSGSPPLATAMIVESAVATSGDYQRYFLYNGERMHHIISPFTLYPSNDYRSVSVIAETAVEADILSTALFLLPLDKGITLLDNHNAAAFWLLNDGETKIYQSKKAKSFFVETK